MTEPVIVQNYFARWRRRSTGRWSRIHWFRSGEPACGLDPGPGEYDLELPPEPLLTCVKCQRENRRAAS